MSLDHIIKQKLKIFLPNFAFLSIGLELQGSTAFLLYVQPFFLPVSMHVVLAALRELRRYKQEKAKYLAWKAKASTAT